MYKKEEYLNNNEQKVEIVNNEDIIYCDEVFVELKAEDIIRFYSVFPHIYTEETKINVTFETTNKKLKDKNLEFVNNVLNQLNDAQKKIDLLQKKNKELLFKLEEKQYKKYNTIFKI